MLGLKGKLKKEKEIADMIQLILLDVKENFKNVKLDEKKLDNELLLFIMHQVELRCKELLSKKTLKSIDKNDVTRSIYSSLFSEMSQEELDNVTNNIEFILTNKLIQVNNWIIKKTVRSFFSWFVKR